MKKKKRIKKQAFFSLRYYFLFFCLIAFVLTCSMLLFLDDLDTQNINYTKNAFATFMNVLLLSLLLTISHGLYYKLTVEKDIHRILEATQKIVKGDFDVRIDSTHKIQGSNELDIIIDNFNEMAEELRSIETLRTDFISNVSHELKTPLAVIRNYAELMQDETLPRKQIQEYAANIGMASRDLSNLIANILKLNRLENQKIFLDNKKYNLSEQLIQSLLGFENIIEEKNIALQVDLDEDIYIEADQELLMIVWNNLLSNAFKFTEDQGTVSVSAKQKDDKIVVSISDTGCGMSREVGKHIFEKFYQGDTSHATQGNGLGLALVKRIIDIMKASIYVESVLGEGTTFVVELNQNEK